MAQYMEQAEEPTLGGFLEEVALYTEADRDDGSDDKVTLMTVHSAKGLEYNNIFVVGMDDGIFPSSRSFDSEEDMEEEVRVEDNDDEIAFLKNPQPLWPGRREAKPSADGDWRRNYSRHPEPGNL